jgi:hypothetical protein
MNMNILPLIEHGAVIKNATDSDTILTAELNGWKFALIYLNFYDFPKLHVMHKTASMAEHFLMARWVNSSCGYPTTFCMMYNERPCWRDWLFKHVSIDRFGRAVIGEMKS